VPFLDQELVALAARIPDRFRQHGAQSKWILKKAMEGTLPNDVIYRPKTGFGVPLRAWMRGPLKTMMYDLLSTDTLRKRGLFDPTAVSRLLSEHEMGQTDYAYSILSLMCIELWCQGFIDSMQAGWGVEPMTHVSKGELSTAGDLPSMHPMSS
jgi:asparagine synthase (glutamine-hydrolysing)